MNKVEKEIFVNKIFSDYKTPSDDFSYIYRGMLSISISDSILELTERNFEEYELDNLTFKKVYFILVEILQNVTKYQQYETEHRINSIVIVQRLKNNYFLTVGNLINNSEIANLKARIDKVNSLNKEELNEYYKHILINGKYNKKGGAGLGLINIKRRSRHKLNYSFSRVSDDFSYFYFNSIISENVNEEIDFSFDEIKKTHKVFKNDKISLLFSNVFDQDKLKGLLQIIEEKLEGKLLSRKRVFNILVEMLQNIIYHTTSSNDFVKEKFGVFLVSETSKLYKLKAGNYIHNKDVKGFKAKLDKVNHYTPEELENAYVSELTNFTKTNTSNLGILDIKMKSSSYLNYEFQEINEEYTFFLIEVNIDKA